MIGNVHTKKKTLFFHLEVEICSIKIDLSNPIALWIVVRLKRLGHCSRLSLSHKNIQSTFHCNNSRNQLLWLDWGRVLRWIVHSQRTLAQLPESPEGFKFFLFTEWKLSLLALLFKMRISSHQQYNEAENALNVSSVIQNDEQHNGKRQWVWCSRAAKNYHLADIKNSFGTSQK